ncbi:MAG: HAD-IIIA family hydrolase [Verrucomicrobiota bacterium]
MSRPAVFFDRDGVLNDPREHYYVTSWKDFHFLEGACELVQLVKARGWLAVLVTSQKAVGKGLLSLEGLAEIHARLQERLESGFGVAFDGIYAYTGADDEGRGAKPKPDLVWDAAEALAIDLDRSWVLGDSDRDIAMGQRAGLAKTLRVLSAGREAGVEADETFSSVAEALAWFRVHLPEVTPI